MAFYGRKEYWDERYTLSTDPYEWYQSYHGIRHLFDPVNLSAVQGVNPANPRRILEGKDRDFMSHHIVEKHPPKTNFPKRDKCRTLIVGCGNSRLGEDMIRDGWTGGIVCIDWSNTVIEQMQAKYNENFLRKISDESICGNKQAADLVSVTDSRKTPEFSLIEYMCADILEGLPFQDGVFDLIISKGSFDALLSTPGSVANVKKMNQECHRLLDESHGSMVIITNGNPESRLVYLEQPGDDEWWSGIGIHNLSKLQTERRHLIVKDATKFHHAYICRKKAQIRPVA
eukprot:CAMPEP_0194255602 /NCGR_PEP_ID=MMETSP0158-20130606/34803_1 /TAXON_ID=33649 /ORGANISM="Thalassionema nitzschioides, Strain L26-B" /LENGTH=285 /DNA_ID=CAMNT_0038994005 /DNA_START=140 /DNA_END=997 /DNA_ORIENTATION=+